MWVEQLHHQLASQQKGKSRGRVTVQSAHMVDRMKGAHGVERLGERVDKKTPELLCTDNNTQGSHAPFKCK